LEFAIAVFVVACPCGIALAAPTALFVGCGLAAKHGVLARGGGEAFQEASQLDVIVFDKTGTLTEGGQPKVTDTDLTPIYPADLVLGVAAELESRSSHPLATAVRSYCATQACASAIASEVEETAGRGLKGLVRLTSSEETLEAIVGNEAWLDEHGVLIEQGKRLILHSWKSQGKSVVLLAIRNTASTAAHSLAALFALADPLREEAPAVIRQLQRQGVATWLITGDNEITAKAVASLVGISSDHVIAGVLPQGKVRITFYAGPEPQIELFHL
jgi:Cu+-exporting ATPase